MTLVTCIGMFISQHIRQVWGIVYLYSGFVRTSCQINKQLHTFFLHIIRRLGVER